MRARNAGQAMQLMMYGMKPTTGEPWGPTCKKKLQKFCSVSSDPPNRASDSTGGDKETKRLVICLSGSDECASCSVPVDDGAIERVCMLSRIVRTQTIAMSSRSADITRQTAGPFFARSWHSALICFAETSINLHIDVDGQGTADVATGIGFLDHMISQLCKFSRMSVRCSFRVWPRLDSSLCRNIVLRCQGDLAIDDHHTTGMCSQLVTCYFWNVHLIPDLCCCQKSQRII